MTVYAGLMELMFSPRISYMQTNGRHYVKGLADLCGWQNVIHCEKVNLVKVYFQWERGGGMATTINIKNIEFGVRKAQRYQVPREWTFMHIPAFSPTQTVWHLTAIIHYLVDFKSEKLAMEGVCMVWGKGDGFQKQTAYNPKSATKLGELGLPGRWEHSFLSQPFSQQLLCAANMPAAVSGTRNTALSNNRVLS